MKYRYVVMKQEQCPVCKGMDILKNHVLDDGICYCCKGKKKIVVEVDLVEALTDILQTRYISLKDLLENKEDNKVGVVTSPTCTEVNKKCRTCGVNMFFYTPVSKAEGMCYVCKICGYRDYNIEFFDD